MSMLDLRQPEDEAMLELLAQAFREDAQPPPSGLASLFDVLDAEFGDEHALGPTVVPLRQRLTRIVLGTAAAIVVLALGLAWYGWQRSSSSPLNRTKLDYATASLRRDLQDDRSPAGTAHDVATLAHLLSQVPTPQRAQVGPEPGRLIAEACRGLSGSSTPPGISFPTPCRSVLHLPSTNQPTGRPGHTTGSFQSPGSTTPGHGTQPPWYITTPPTSVPTRDSGHQGTTPSTDTGGTSSRVPVGVDKQQAGDTTPPSLPAPSGGGDHSPVPWSTTPGDEPGDPTPVSEPPQSSDNTHAPHGAQPAAESPRADPAVKSR